MSYEEIQTLTQREYDEQCEEDYHYFLSSLSPEEREMEIQIDKTESKIFILNHELLRLKFQRKKLKSIKT